MGGGGQLQKVKEVASGEMQRRRVKMEAGFTGSRRGHKRDSIMGPNSRCKSVRGKAPSFEVI